MVHPEVLLSSEKKSFLLEDHSAQGQLPGTLVMSWGWGWPITQAQAICSSGRGKDSKGVTGG